MRLTVTFSDKEIMGFRGQLPFMPREGDNLFCHAPMSGQYFSFEVTNVNWVMESIEKNAGYASVNIKSYLPSDVGARVLTEIGWKKR